MTNMLIYLQIYMYHSCHTLTCYKNTSSQLNTFCLQLYTYRLYTALCEKQYTKLFYAKLTNLKVFSRKNKHRKHGKWYSAQGL